MKYIPHWLPALLLLFATRTYGQQQIYVSPEGNDNNPGTAAKPVASPQKALQLAQKQHVTHITLRKGRYYLDSALRITAASNGLTIQGEEAVLSGAKRLRLTWKPWKNGIYRAAVSASVKTIDQLFVHGEQQIIARYPNYDSSASHYHGTAADALDSVRILKWKHPEGGIVHALHRAEWGGYHYRITGMANGKPRLTGGWQNNRQMGMSAKHLFVENILEELDAPREWYFDSAAHLLYYQPVAGVAPPAVAEAVQLQELVRIEGTPEAPVKNVKLDHLEFTGVARTFMLTAEPLLRSDWTIYRGGAVMITGAVDCEVAHCYFNRPGGNAVFVSGYARGINIHTNRIDHAGASGICFVGEAKAVRAPALEYYKYVPFAQMDLTPGPQTEDYPARCTANGNLIQYTGEVEKQSAGVQISMAKDIRVLHNTIHNVPRAGINVSEGTWGGHEIGYNDVYNTVLETGDHGAFNSWGRDRYWIYKRGMMDSLVAARPDIILLDVTSTITLHDNRFRCDHGWDIDLDDGSSNYHIYNNVCLNGGLKLREGFYRKVENNIMINNSFHPHVWFKNSHDVFRYNIVTSGYKPIGVNYWGDEVDHNFFPDQLTLKAAQYNGTDSASLYGDPQFADFEKGDYRVAGIALHTGFRNFPMDQFGVTDPVLKTLAAPTPLPDVLKKPDANAPVNWQGSVLKNVGLGERSATVLPDENGVYVVSVKAGSKAAAIGLKPADVIRMANGKVLRNVQDFYLFDEKRSGRAVLVVFREQREVTLEMK